MKILTYLPFPLPASVFPPPIVSSPSQSPKNFVPLFASHPLSKVCHSVYIFFPKNLWTNNNSLRNFIPLIASHPLSIFFCQFPLNSPPFLSLEILKKNKCLPKLLVRQGISKLEVRFQLSKQDFFPSDSQFFCPLVLQLAFSTIGFV